MDDIEQDDDDKWEDDNFSTHKHSEDMEEDKLHPLYSTHVPETLDADKKVNFDNKANISSTTKTGKGKSRVSQWAVIKDQIAGIAGEAYRLRSEKSVESSGALGLDDPRDREAWRLLELLRNSEFFKTLPEKNQKAIIQEQERKAGKIHALDVIAMKEKGLKVEDEEEEYYSDRKQREKAEEEFKLKFLWKQRGTFNNWFFLILFHAIVLINFLICLISSYRITIEHAKFDRLFLDDDFNCLDVAQSGATVNHIVNICHALLCVAVLFTEKLDTKNLCWGFVVAQIIHVMSNTFQFLYSIRFPSDDKEQHDAATVSLFVVEFIFMIFSAMIVIRRYYDMSNIVVNREKRFTSSIFGGRILNEHIIYKNESDFLQKKFTVRQATSIQIYGIVQKIQHYRDRGLEANPKEIASDVKAAIATLQEMKAKHYSGPNMLRELKTANNRKLKILQETLNSEIED